jgi:histone H2B
MIFPFSFCLPAVLSSLIIYF